MSALTCQNCGAHENVTRSDALDLTLCGRCFAERAETGRIAALLAEAEAFIDRYLVLPGEAERTAIVLWIAHTHALDGAHATPYLLFLSPEKRAGKTRALELLELLTARSWRVTGMTEAVLFRKIAQDRPTLLLDEIDAIFGSGTERTQPLRGILNAGNRPGVSVARCVGEKGDQLRDFPVYCPKALAGIDSGNLPETIRDRSISIRMRRKTGSEPVERFRYRHAEERAEGITAGLAAWGSDATARLHEAEPDLPAELNDRAAEAWEPLLAIADEAGGDWPERARRAAVALSGPDGSDADSIGALLLGAIRDAFGERRAMFTKDILAAVNAREDLPFGGWRNGDGLDARTLGKLLRQYDVSAPDGEPVPRTIRIGGETLRGYERDWFRDAWERWLPQHPGASATDSPHEQANVADVALVADSPGGPPSEATLRQMGLDPVEAS